MKILLDRKRGLIKLHAENGRENEILRFLFDFLYHDAETHRVIKHSFGLPLTRKKGVDYSKKQVLTFKVVGDYAKKVFFSRFTKQGRCSK